MKRPPFFAAIGVIAVALLSAFFILSTLLPEVRRPLFLRCLQTITSPSGSGYSPAGAAALAEAAVHYATTTSIPQQSRAEISLSLSVLRRRAPLRLLVFGLGRDSRLWQALNPGGVTVFLEEDPVWFRSIRSRSLPLRSYIVTYRTRLADAKSLLASYKSFPACLPNNVSTLHLRGNAECPLALHNLPAEVYENEWDMVMIDAPKGYFDAAPGRMAAIFSVAVMARARKGDGDTDVFLHDVDRKVEKVFAEEFLCGKFRVGAVGRLWHFSIPPVSRRGSLAGGSERPFC